MFSTDLFKGHRILVTGGGSGLGFNITEKLLELGADVCICGRRGSVLEEAKADLAGRHAGRIDTYSVDIRDPAAVERMIEAIWQDGPPLTGLVNNAAGNFISRTEDLSPNGFDTIANIVFHGTFYVTQNVGKRWLNEGRKGSVLSIVVSWIWTGCPFVIPSTMSKAGVEAMTKSLAIEWGSRGIRLNAIAPGIFPTEGATGRLRPNAEALAQEAAANPMRRLGRPEELANVAAFLLSDGAEWLTGQTLAIDGGHYLANGSYFKENMHWTDDDWAQAKQKIVSLTEQDKRKRTAALSN